MSKYKETFESLYEQYWQRIYRLALGYVNDVDWAKDIAQETFVNVWNQLPKFRADSGYGTWIYRIAVNICLRQIERSKKVMPDESKIRQSKSVEEEYKETNTQKLYQAISELTEINRIIISLTLEGVEQKQIADVTGLTHANVRTRVHRIKEELYQKLNNYGK
ncbi:RNA polymerase sigma factor [Myroides odoratimimus]|uniref:RNA polymerase subunit sigma-24 n=1 Tax=Myroides odoratimimus TaxID=76832 RepID=A0AAI8C8V8_9FLAO|nr:RNA polymerase sigma factor [Myroides odoratimimus]ALU28117.1 RNA polymerase subunit sigma-24 [Myroides odoratimimus]MDM1039477.1 RNA polymerase sigma factor [Myroides odoratimimus]MDM1053707.1 RNA polymerase sigma factor [Myroides odoratimimus]MDM1411498.1 RNA polymerase sigma factor [Myroides odoratimimus]MDM1460340.1 RNA polymerase sigma factor [Myroides odoratimimus]